MSTPAARERAIASYRVEYGMDPTLVVRAPGRVNLIGEHTDYNDGFVLPMALPFEVVVAGRPRGDDRVLARSEGFEPVEFSIADPLVSPSGWATYLHGTARMLVDEGHQAGGWQGQVASDIPAGASLSSSAALEIAAGLVFVTSAGSSIDRAALARIGQRVENEVLGLPSGIMDQLASATAVEGAASLIDCRELTATPVLLPSGVEIVIMDSGTRRELVDSAYGDRRADCEAAAAMLGVAALRDATADQLGQLTDERVHRRARHVITENARTLDAAAAMRAGDPTELGRLFDASHVSLRDDFEVSGPALDEIVAVAQTAPGCFGARMTGGGFAGATVALVASDRSNEFIDYVRANFVAPVEQPSTEPVRLYAAKPAAGASIIARP